DRVQLILAYNTPEDLPVEAELHQLANQHEMLEVLRVHGSTSKAENLIAAIEIARGSVTAIIDSDHRLHPESARRAIRWFDEGYDIVQGRCVIRNADDSFLARLVSIEFEQIYGLAHAGRSLLMDTAIFGGANGWWRTEVLRELGFDKSMLTEDIDISMRSMLSGFKIIHDRSVMSTELAPTGWGAWWKQRTRWAQGWLQVTMRHQRSVMESPVLSWPLKAYWSVLLTWRELFPVIALQIFTLAFSELVTEGRVRFQFDPLDGLSMLLTVSSGFIGAWATWRLSTPETREAHGPWRYVLFGAFAAPYTMLRNSVALVALAREALGDHRWVVTARTKGAPAVAGAAALLASLVAFAGVSPHAAQAAVAGVDMAAAAPRTTYLVNPSSQPSTLSPATPNFSTDLALPGYWHAVEGTVTLRLSGATQLAKSSRLAVVVNGRQVAAGIALPGDRTIQVAIPRQLVPDHTINVTVSASLTTQLNACPSSLDPTARMQILPGTKVELRPELSRNITIADAPGALINAFGSGPSSVRIRFKGKRTASAIRAAGVVSGSIAAARGYPGVAVRIVDGHRRATLTIADRPGPSRMTIRQVEGVPTLAIAGHGNDLVKAALELLSPNHSIYNTPSVVRPSADPLPRVEFPDRISLDGAEEDQSGTSTATSLFNIPGRYEVRAGARLRVTGSVEGVGTTRTSVTINGRTIQSRIST
ncbi:MAG: glycosyltransferase family 2 protein, partial [Solirubrobacteraceae bacterium]